MPTKTEKMIVLIDLLNDIPNVEYKMVGFTKQGMANISKAKVINHFGVEYFNTLMNLSPETELFINDNVTLIHYTVYGKQMIAINNKYGKKT